MAGARHSKQDQADIQAAHDAIVRAGGVCAHEDEADEPDDMETADAMKALEDLSPAPEQYAVKSLGNGRIGGYAVLWGDKDHADLEGDYFTPETNFYLDTTGPKRPMIYDHGRDPATKSRPVVGIFDTAEPRDLGLWVEGQLDLSHRYQKAINTLVERGVVRMSSDSVPHLVRRKQAAKGVHQVTDWPLFGISLTVHPMEPRMIPVESIKSAYEAAGLDFDIPASPEPEAASEGATAQRDDARARRISLELDLLTL